MACPISGKPPHPKYRPLSSTPCAHIDLARWLRGDYVLPGPPAEEDEAPDPQGEEREG